MESGFYKKEGKDGLVFAPESLLNKDYVLYREDKDTYSYPVDGWYWFETRDEALEFFAMRDPEDTRETEDFSAEELKEIVKQSREVISLFLNQEELTEDDLDEIIEKSAFIFSDYQVDVKYYRGDIFSFQGKLYQVIQLHTSQADWIPSELPALYKEIAPPGVIPDWRQPLGSEDAYRIGDIVKHNGFKWISVVDFNVWEPGVYGWEITD